MEGLESKVEKFFESVGNFFSGGDQIPWCERGVIAGLRSKNHQIVPGYSFFGCEREVSEAEKGTELFKECLMHLSWSLVHYRHPEDVLRGTAMLEASASDANNIPLQLRETTYLLDVGYYRSGDYSKSRELVEQCIMSSPDWRQAQTLKKLNEDRIKRDGAIGIGIAATAGIAATVARKK